MATPCALDDVTTAKKAGKSELACSGYNCMHKCNWTERHMPPRAGRHFLQIPGPSNVPDRVLRAIDRPVIDHRGPEFAKLAGAILQGLKSVFKTMDPIVIYPASGTGAWEAALVNTLSPGDKVLMFETGHFATLWCQLAERLSLIDEAKSHRSALSAGKLIKG